MKSIAGAAAWLVAACSGPEPQHPSNPGASPAVNADPAATATPPRTSPTPDRAVGDVPASTATSGAGAGADSTATTPAATATPRRRVTVAADPDLPEALVPRATEIRNQLAQSMGGVVVDGDADFIVAVAGQSVSAATSPVLPVDYAAVVSRRLLVRDVSFEDLGKIWNGSIGDWIDIGSPVSHGVVRYSVLGTTGLLDPARVERDVASVDELATALETERGGIAILPLEDVDFRFRTLTVDGVNPIRPGDARNPLRVDFEVRPRSGAPGQALRSMVTSMAGDPGPQPVSMTWAGDIILGRLVHVKMVSYGDWAAPFRTIHPEITWADVTISNLECAISDSYTTPTSPTTFDFKTDTPAIAGLQLAQIEILSRANNHSFNFGPIGMRDTTAVLEQAGILHFGMGEDIHESRRATVIERGGTTYAFLGYNGISDAWDGAGEGSPGTNPMLDWLVVEDVYREVERGHVVIPFFHWGTEYVYDPTEQQRYFAHVAIQSGAAMVMGSHPHWVQGVETYLGKPIVYSLGNFVFDQEWSRQTKEGMIAHVWMKGGKPLSIDLVPILIEDHHKPRRMANWEAWPVLEEIWAASDRIIANP
ncbi:MAG TPA: CapA family protein [Thermomicrobiales bacterium]|nr:CapA family protein [Thermomicrobiales bacterium]